MSVLHKIRAYIHQGSSVNDNPESYIAHPVNKGSHSTKQICKAAVDRGEADISAAFMEHAVNLFFKEMAYQLCDGYAVNTGYFTAHAQIEGELDRTKKNFDADNYDITFLFDQGNKLRTEISNIRVEIQGTFNSSAAIILVTDIKSNTVNSLLTPGRILKIAGNKIKIAGADKGNGVFFINTATRERTAVDSGDIITNSSSKLIVVIPSGLTAGTYMLEIVTQYAGNVLLREPCIARLPNELTVSPLPLKG